MHLYLSSEDPETLEGAQAYLEKSLSGNQLPQKQLLEKQPAEKNLSAAAFRKKAESKSSVEYEAELSEEDGESLLEQLLVTFPELNISATFIYDIEGRDRSFWGTTRYQSAVDEDGKRVFEVSSRTDWA